MTVYRPYCRVDTFPHQKLQIYSAGNFGEIAPERLSPLSWSLIGSPMERGTRRFVDRILNNPVWSKGADYVFTGYFYCRPYHNLTAYCLIADGVNIIGPQDVTDAYFEGIPPPPSPIGARRSSIARNLSTVKMANELVTLRPRVVELEQQVFQFERLVRSVIRLGQDWRLGELASEGSRLLERAWYLHIVGTSGSIVAEVAQNRVIERLDPKSLSLVNWFKEPAELPWTGLIGLTSIGDGPAEFLDYGFYEIMDSVEPWSDFVIQPVGRSDSRSGRGSHITPRQALVDMNTGIRGKIIDSSVLFLGDVMSLRERSKSLAMRLLHAYRLFVPHIARMRDLDPLGLPYVSIEELRGDLPDAAEIDARRVSCFNSINFEAPDYLDFSSDLDAQIQPKRTARGVSGGMHTGTVIGLEDISVAAGSVLVCESADANIMPLLPFLGAVVTARGSQYSHVAIICREMGIPAVVSHPIAREIFVGQKVQVNGSTAEVKIVE
ncbi:PEP-utilizing enzyme [Nocardia sp. NPDC058114]|uniref:PEP-utilizing enzyme n=1 Tax=Nocardia sp. NPDC058114 TaxID=3346346 RepID=UPI0036DEEAE9